MNILDIMTQGYQNDGGSDSPIGMSPGAASVGTPPNVMDLLAQTQNQPLPEVPQPSEEDMKMLRPLLLLHMAAAVSQPKRKGQSTVGKVLESGALTANAGLNMRKQLEDRAMQQEIGRRKLAESELSMQQSRLAIARGQQQIQEGEETREYNRERRPLELETLQHQLDNAKDTKSLNAIRLRVESIKERYTEKEIQAGLNERAAKTDRDRAAAMQDREQARLYRVQADEFLKAIQLRAQGKPEYQPIEGIPGVSPDRIFDKRTGQSYLAPMDAQSALRYATAEADAESEMSDGKIRKGSTEWKVRRQHYYNMALKGTVPMTGTSGDSGALPPSDSGAAPGAPARSPEASALREVIAKSAAEPNQAFSWSYNGQTKYFIGGKEVDKAEVDRRMKKPGKDRAQEAGEAQITEEQRRLQERSRQIAGGANAY